MPPPAATPQPLMLRAAACCIVSSLLSSCVTTTPGSRVAGSVDAVKGSNVQLVKNADGDFTLLRNGAPYWVAGAGGSRHLPLLVASGGNSIRTWGIEQLEDIVDGKPLLDRAHELGISVTAGFWVQHERHGFDYSDPVSVERQRNRLREAVLKYKDHPALLVWGLGNEMEAFSDGASKDYLWQELNHLTGIIKQIDNNHPVMTVIAGAAQDKIDAIKRHYPKLDILGVNSYGGAAGVGRQLAEMGWQGAYMLTEFGVPGTWEVAVTPWGAPIEPDPSSAAATYYLAYTTDRDENRGRSLGSYAFHWGHKQEATATWFGMFLVSGEKTPRVDAMAFAWSGEWPANRAPKLESLDASAAFKRVKSGSVAWAEVDCIDREGDPLRYVWDIKAESTDRKVGGDPERPPPSFPDAIREGQGTNRIVFDAPLRSGGYRVFVTAYDGRGGAVSHNLPFFVED